MGSEINWREFKLLTTKRNGKIAFWLDFGGGDKWNIGDVPPKQIPTEHLPTLLRRAFEMGWRAHKQNMQWHLYAECFKITEEDPDERAY